MSPTARTLAYLRKLGYEAGVVERHNTFSGKKSDLFGCLDIVAINERERMIVGIQATSGSNVSARVKKSMAEPRLQKWLQSGGLFYVIGWRKKKVKRGGKAVRWIARAVGVVLDGDTLRSVEA